MKKEITNFDTDPTQIEYYLVNGQKPKNLTIYTHKSPEYLVNFNEGKPNRCPIHGDHLDWNYSPQTKMGKYFYDVMKCKKCNALAALHWHYIHPIKAMIKDAKYHSKTRGLKFALSNRDLFGILKKQKNRCAYSNIKFNNLYMRPSLDQIVPRRGYLVGNVQVLHKKINVMKSNFSEKYFFNLIKLVFEFRIKTDGKFGAKALMYDVGIVIKNRNYVEERIKIFEKGEPIECAKHGKHRLWHVSLDKRYNKKQIRCIVCRRETTNRTRQRKNNGELSVSAEISKQLETFNKTGKSFCPKHGYHTQFKMKNSRDLRCLRCDQEYRDKRYSEHPLVAIYQSRQSEMKRKKTKGFNLSLKDLENQYIKQNGRCWYTGMPLLKGKMGGISIERLNSSEDYIPENICLCFTDINTMKSDIALKEFKEFCELIYDAKQLYKMSLDKLPDPMGNI